MKAALSICIPTLNRAEYIGAMLQSIVSQWETGVEVIIVDGGSTDGTAKVVSSYQRACPGIRYVRKEKAARQPSNEGFDRDCNHAVELAAGEYCWLMTDDDVLMPGAIAKILSETRKGYPLIVTAVEVRNKDLTKVVVPRRPELSADHVYQPNEWNEFATKVGGCLTFVGAVIIQRRLWLDRDREKYFGSGFIHVGVILSEPIGQNVLVIATPLVSIRHGNAHWSTRAFQIWLFNWPDLIWSFSSISDTAKQTLAPREGCRNFKALLLLRALEEYSVNEYQSFLSARMPSKKERWLAKFIAHVPRSSLYIPAYLYLYARGAEASIVLFNLRNSR